MIFVVSGANAQDFTAKIKGTKPAFPILPATGSSSHPDIRNAFRTKVIPARAPQQVVQVPLFLLSPRSGNVISADYYTRNFGFFCRQELQFEKATKIPLRFRLGSMAYNDYLERKPNAGVVPGN